MQTRQWSECKSDLQELIRTTMARMQVDPCVLSVTVDRQDSDTEPTTPLDAATIACLIGESPGFLVIQRVRQTKRGKEYSLVISRSPAEVR